MVRTVHSPHPRPAPPPPPPVRPVVIIAPPAGPPPAYGRPVQAAPAPAHVPPGQLRSAEVHRRNAERKAQHDADKAEDHEGKPGHGKAKGKKKHKDR
jgi:hypothetical protein